MVALRSIHKLGFVVPVIAVWVCAGASAAGREGVASVSAIRGFTTGSDAHLRNAIGGVADRSELYFRVTPVAPYAGLSYPPQSTWLDENAGTMSSPGGGHLIWFEIRMGNFANAGDGILKGFQWTLGPDAALPAGITRSAVACSNHADCNAAGLGSRDGTGGAWDSGCDPGSGTCNSVYQEIERPDHPQSLAAAGFCPFSADCDQADLACGGTVVGTPCVVDSGFELYLGTAVLALDAAATGTIVLQLQGIDVDTFFREGSGSFIPIGKVQDAIIRIPTGRCCELDTTCTPEVTLSECWNRRFWIPGTACPNDNGPVCCGCFTDADCRNIPTEFGKCDIGFCLNSCYCFIEPIPGWEPGGPVCCDPATGALVNRNDGNPCTLDACSVDDENSLGMPQPDPGADGVACIDGDPCTAEEVCSNGVCVGDDVSGQPCTTTPDCQSGGQTPAAVCVDGTCFCGDDVVIPTVSEWGLVMLMLLLLIGAKTVFRRPASAV